MHIITFDKLIGHDVYEFCYEKNYPSHWNVDSIFVDSDEFQELSTVIDDVIQNYHYYGPQKVTYKEWEQIKTLLCLNPSYENAIYEIDNWIKRDSSSCNYFWIFGV